MANIFDPKRDFMRDTKAREKHSMFASDPDVHRTIGIAVAEMNARGLGPNDMAGVVGFVHVWLNLSEESPPMRSLPSKPLESYGQPIPQPKEF